MGEREDERSAGAGRVDQTQRHQTRGRRFTRQQKLGVGAIVAVLAISSFIEPKPVVSEDSQRATASQTGAASSELPSCEASATGVEVGVRGRHELLTQPKDGAAPLPWKVGNETVAATVDDTIALRELCRTGAWSQVRVIVPRELRSWQGWVPVSALVKVPVDGSGRRIYRPHDFDLPTLSAVDRLTATAIANRIMKDREDCDALDTQSLTVRGRGRNAALSIGCVGEQPRSFDFTLADAANGRSFAPVEPLDKMAAIEGCKKEVLRRATHPSTVSFPTFDYDYRDDGNGSTQLLMSASAKNGFGLELSYDVECHFVGSEVSDFVMSEASDT